MRVLVVEDFDPLRNSIAQGLEEAGYAVDQTGDGEEGLWYARTNEYDVIVLDLMLPGLDGLSLLRHLRAEGKETHVLILTARDALENRVEGLNAGADDYLVKPFGFSELLARVAALVRRGYRRKSPALEYGNLALDTVARTVHCQGGPVALTAREYSLLEYLASRAHQTVSRDEIREHLYDFAAEAGSNVIDVYVGYLRKKLRSAEASVGIRTVRGLGYVFGEPCQ